MRQRRQRQWTQQQMQARLQAGHYEEAPEPTPEEDRTLDLVWERQRQRDEEQRKAAQGRSMTLCRRCGGEVVQKPCGRLVLVGVALLSGVFLGVARPLLWLPALTLALTGAYLVAWALVGRGRWCRGCKRFEGV